MTKKLGRLETVELRKYWKDEAKEFTPWLATQDVLGLLGQEIGLDISLDEIEASVGKYKVDILAEEENTGSKIVIENQLENTNHDHLGKIITYASGYDAKFIIWVVKDIRDEHKQAIDWLNEHTDEEINLFIVKIELWKIGNSEVAPKFQIVSKPNEWAKAVKKLGKSELSETNIIQLDFWSKLKDHAKDQGSKLRFSKVYPQHWLNISLGIPRSNISLTISVTQNWMACEVYIFDSKEQFHTFEESKDKIEKEIGSKLEWMELPDKKASRVKLTKQANLNKSDKWEEYFEWLTNTAESFHKVFPKYAK